jgi:hypothetical protein
MVNLGHFVIGRKHEFCVIDLFEIDASLNLSANFDRSALRVLLQNDGELSARWYPLLYQRAESSLCNRARRSAGLVKVFASFFSSSNLNHSVRNATSGSTCVARRAGIQHASSATTISNELTMANVAGSVALTS